MGLLTFHFRSCEDGVHLIKVSGLGGRSHTSASPSSAETRSALRMPRIRDNTKDRFVDEADYERSATRLDINGRSSPHCDISPARGDVRSQRSSRPTLH